MKPPVFSYAAPETIEDCVALLSQYSDGAKILAGGQSLMPLLNLRMVRPSVIIDIGRVRGLDRWEKHGNVVRIGALVRQRVIETDKALKAAVPLLSHVIPLIGHPATRSRGTIVGSMCHADPAAELPVCAVLLGAEFLLRSSKGTRTVKADEFFEGALSTAVQSDEIVEAVNLPVAPAGAGYAFDEIARRHGDFALVSVGAAVVGGEAKVAIGGAASRPTGFRYADFSPGKVDRSKIVAFGQYVAERLEPNTDLHATAEYRRNVTGALVERTLLSALERTKRS
jgi:CO/xanthine dehydrogenase FAD-binding subunit